MEKTQIWLISHCTISFWGVLFISLTPILISHTLYEKFPYTCKSHMSYNGKLQIAPFNMFMGQSPMGFTIHQIFLSISMTSQLQIWLVTTLIASTPLFMYLVWDPINFSVKKEVGCHCFIINKGRLQRSIQCHYSDHLATTFPF